MMRKKIGLFFGSFNPVHIGHMALANYFVEFSPVQEIWFVVSPHSPFKEKGSLLADHHRLEMVYQAIDSDSRFRASNIEFKLPQPNYTAHTLVVLEEKYPDYDFSLIMGSDNLEGFMKWKNADVMLSRYSLLVYPRPGHPGGSLREHPAVTFVDAPLLDISASFIREAVRNGKNLKYFIPGKAFQYMQEMHFYEKG